jgi:hypothetical protein
MTALVLVVLVGPYLFPVPVPARYRHSPSYSPARGSLPVFYFISSV